jgi:pantetheine-phosphate adenylyltransferase
VKDPLFSVEERAEMLQESTSELGNVSVATFEGLMVEYARQIGASVVLRGIRAISDYEYEFQHGADEPAAGPGDRDRLLQPAGRYSFVSSRMVKEVFSFGGDVIGPGAAQRLQAPARPHGPKLTPNPDTRLSKPSSPCGFPRAPKSVKMGSYYDKLAQFFQSLRRPHWPD